jgi:hypothetical protein
MAKTLKDIEDRCRMVDGHWLWAGAMSDGWPRVYAPDYVKGGRQLSQPGRRAVWHVVHRKPIPDGWRVFGTCDEPTCLNPDHIACEPPAKRGEKVAASGKWKGNIRKIAASRAAGRKRSHLTPEMIEYILSSPKTGKALSEELKIGRTIISNARRGKARAFMPVGGLFTGLLAANDSKRRSA